MKATTFDTLEIARKLKNSGVPEDQAEVIAEGMREAAVADRDDLATKGDIALLRTEIAAVRTELKGDIARLEGDIAAVRTEIAAVRKLLYIVLVVVITAAINSFFFT